MLKHKHVKRTRPTVELDQGQMRTIYVIETDLALTPDDPDFDEAAFTELAEAARDYLSAHESTYEAIRIERVR